MLLAQPSRETTPALSCTCTRVSHQTHDNAVNAAENQYIRLSRMPMSA